MEAPQPVRPSDKLLPSKEVTGLLNSLIDELKCSVCFELFREPRSLPCTHSFCTECLCTLVVRIVDHKDWPKHSESSSTVSIQVQCPLCRLNHRLSAEHGVLELPRNHYLVSMIEKMKLYGSVRDWSKSPDLWRERQDRFSKMAWNESENGPCVYHLKFIIQREDVCACLVTWMSGLTSAPNDLIDLYNIGETQKVYVPFWEFEVGVNTTYTASSATPGPEAPLFVTGSRKATYRRLACAASRIGEYRGLCSLLVADCSMDDAVLGRIDVQEPVDWPLVFREEVEKALLEEEEKACAEILADEHKIDVCNLKVTTSYYRLEPRLICLPFYISSYSYMGQSYRFAINGQTGQVAGEHPTSWNILSGLRKILQFL